MTIPGSKRSVVKAIGPMPECAGHYAEGDKECDGKPCSWRAGCQVYREYAMAQALRLGVDTDGYIESEARALPHAVKTQLVIGLLRHRPVDLPPRQPGHAKGWDRFLEGFRTREPGVSLHASRRHARYGELYIKRWRRGEKDTLAYIIRVKRPVARDDVSLFRYWLGIKSRVEPDIEIRAPVKVILTAWPHIEQAASRWKGVSRKTARSRIGARAIGVFAERIEDFGRLCSFLLREEHLPGVRVADEKVEANEEAYRWRLATR